VSEASDITSTASPKPTIRFFFNISNSLTETKKFYGDLIGMQVNAYGEEWGYLCFQCEGFELMFFKPDEPVPVETRWASQPGYEGGKLDAASWAVFVAEEEFRDVVERLRRSGAKLFRERPEWRQESYWGLTVMDPNGVTVEVYTSPKVRPDTTVWRD